MARKRGIYKLGTTYYGRWTENGKLVRRALSTDYSAACDMLDDLRETAVRTKQGVGSKKYKWDRLVEEYLRQKRQTRRVGTTDGYDVILQRFTAYAKPTTVADVTRDVLTGYRASRLAEGRSNRTVNKEATAVSTLLNWGVKERKIPENVLQGFEKLAEDNPTKERRDMHEDEFARLLAASPESLVPAWILLCSTGIRRSELVALRFADIDYQQSQLIVRAVSAKGKKLRRIPLRAEVLDMLREVQAAAPNRVANYRTKHDVDHDYVIVNAAGCRYRHAGNLLRSFYTYCKKAGIEDAKRGGSLDIHALRGTTVTWLFAATPASRRPCGTTPGCEMKRHKLRSTGCQVSRRR